MSEIQALYVARHGDATCEVHLNKWRDGYIILLYVCGRLEFGWKADYYEQAVREADETVREIGKEDGDDATQS